MNLDQMSRDELLRELKRLLGEEAQTRDKDREKDALLHDLRVHQVELELQNRELRESQNALARSQARFEDLYDFAPVAYYTFYTFDLQGVIQEANLTGATMLGRDRSLLIGQPFLALVKMAEPAQFYAHLRRCRDERGPVVNEMRFSTERSGVLDIQASSVPVLDASDAVVAVRTSFFDISRRKRLEAELERARDEEARLRKRFEVLDRVSARLSWKLARNGEIPEERFFQAIADEARLACDAEYAALGIGTDPTRPFDRWVFSGFAPLIAKGIGRAPSPDGLLGEVIRTARTIRLRDLRQHPRFRGFPPGHPEMRSFLGVVIPDGGKAIGHLYLTNKLTADEFDAGDQETLEMLAHRAGNAIEIQRLTRELRSAVAARDNVLAVVTHDLRSPLSGLQLSADILARELSDAERERVGGRLDSIQRYVDRMNRLIRDLLQASTIQAGTFAIEAHAENVLPVLDQALQSFEALAGKKAVQLRCEAPAELPRIHADRERLLQVLSNLIGNAIKFVPESGHVWLRASALDGVVCFSVTDDGPGIGKEQMPHLFDRYWRADRSHDVGLGLYIAKGIVEAHGGQIWADSRVGEGTTFQFTIPIEPAS